MTPPRARDLDAKDAAASVVTSVRAGPVPWAAAGRRACRAIAIVAFLLVIAIAVMLFVPRPGESLGWTTLVLGGWVVRWLDISMILTALGVVALVVMRLLPASDDDTYRPRRTVAKVALMLAVPACVMGTVLSETQDSYSVLEPSSEGGCSIVTYEGANATDDKGAFGIVQPGSTSVEWIGTVSSLAGFRPFADDEYELVWDGDTATLEAISTDPAYAHVSNEPIVCDA